MRLQLRPDPLGELKRSPRPPSRNKGGLLLRKGEGRGGKGKGGEGMGRGGGGEGNGRGKEREGEREGKEGEGRLASHTIFRPCTRVLELVNCSTIWMIVPGAAAPGK